MVDADTFGRCQRCDKPCRTRMCETCLAAVKVLKTALKQVTPHEAEPNTVTRYYDPDDPLNETPKPRRHRKTAYIKLWAADPDGYLTDLRAAQKALWKHLIAAYRWSKRLSDTMADTPNLCLLRELEGHARDWAVPRPMSARQAQGVAAMFGGMVRRLKRLPTLRDMPDYIRIRGQSATLRWDAVKQCLKLTMQGSHSAWLLRRHRYIRYLAEQAHHGTELGRYAKWNQRDMPVGRIIYIDIRPPTGSALTGQRWQFVIKFAKQTKQEAIPMRHDWRPVGETEKDQRDDTVLAMYRAGDAVAHIAKAVGVSRPTVYAILRRYGVGGKSVKPRGTLQESSVES